MSARTVFSTATLKRLTPLDSRRSAPPASRLTCANAASTDASSRVCAAPVERRRASLQEDDAMHSVGADELVPFEVERIVLCRAQARELAGEKEQRVVGREPPEERSERRSELALEGARRLAEPVVGEPRRRSSSGRSLANPKRRGKYFA